MTTASPQIQFDASRFDPNAWVPASRKRLFLALYIDYLIVGAPWVLIQYLIQQFIPFVGTLPAIGRWLLFGLFELMVFRFKVPSVGATVLSMRQFPYRGTEREGLSVSGQLWFVDSWIKKNESWFSMTVAFLFVSDGVKAAVRWTMWNPPLPVFGTTVSDFWVPAVYVAMGTLDIWIGCLLFKLTMRTFKIVLPYLGVVTVSTLLSWNLWDPFVAELVLRRQAYLGTGRTEERVRMMQAIMPEAMLIALVALTVCAIILMQKYRQLKPRDYSSRLHS